MKTKLITLLLSLFALVALRATDAAPGDLVVPKDQDAAWLAEARAAYPLKTCLLSGEELGGMGKPADFIYRQAGQPDRLVRFCCKMCVSRFKKEPAKYLALLNPEPKPDAKPAPHSHH
jgi:hypothetical protein